MRLKPMRQKSRTRAKNKSQWANVKEDKLKVIDQWIRAKAKFKE